MKSKKVKGALVVVGETLVDMLLVVMATVLSEIVAKNGKGE